MIQKYQHSSEVPLPKGVLQAAAQESAELLSHLKARLRETAFQLTRLVVGKIRCLLSCWTEEFSSVLAKVLP